MPENQPLFPERANISAGHVTSRANRRAHMGARRRSTKAWAVLLCRRGCAARKGLTGLHVTVILPAGRG